MDLQELLACYLNNQRTIDSLDKENNWLRMLALRAKRRCTMYRRMYLTQYHRERRNRTVWSKVKTSNFWERDVPQFDDEKFKNCFRIDRTTFTYLVENLKQLSRKNTSWRSAISIEKRIAVALYTLATSSEYRAVASLFGIGRTTVGEIVIKFCKEISNVFQEQMLNVYSPSQERVDETVKGFEALGFPQCFAVMDGCPIIVSPPNLKGWCCLVLFAVADYRHRFIYINIGSPKSRHNNSNIFSNSLLKVEHEYNFIFTYNSKKIEGVNVPLLLLGNSTFKLSKFVMTPYQSSVDQSEDEKLFNSRLLKCHSVVDNAFSQLKSRFRRIYKGLCVHIDNAGIIIKACCILHNICNERNDKINEIWLKEFEKDNSCLPQQRLLETSKDDGQIGSIIRSAILKHISHENKAACSVEYKLK